MTVNDSINDEKLGVQIQVSSKKIQKLLEKGISPSEALSSVIEYLSNEQIDEIAQGSKNVKKRNFDRREYAQQIDSLNKKIGSRCPECNVLTNKRNPLLEHQNKCTICEVWPYEAVEFYIDSIYRHAKKERPSLRKHETWYELKGEISKGKKKKIWYSGILSLIIAYYESGTSTPTSSVLMEMRMKPKDINNLEKEMPDFFSDMWDEELRTAKSRLTIEAKNQMLEVGPFKAPYGNGEKRKHPLFPSIYRHIKEYFEPTIIPITHMSRTGKKREEYLFKKRHERNKLKNNFKKIPLDSDRLERYQEKQNHLNK